MTTKNYTFLKKCRAIQKKSQEIDKKSPLQDLRREFAYRRRFRVEMAIFRAILSKNSDFRHFLVIFRVKNSIFTRFRLKTGNRNRKHCIPPTLGILKRYHTSPNSQYFPF